MSQQYPVLLTDPDYCGTLAAARCLGKNGYRVWVATQSNTALTMHSRYVERVLHCPPLRDHAAYLEWLLKVGTENPGTLLYPTSDDLAWFEALHGEALNKVFRRWAPPIETYERILDKELLDLACARVGIDTPVTKVPTTAAEAGQMAQQMRMPILIKQRTQVFSTTYDKGVLLHTVDEVEDAFEKFLRTNRHSPALAGRMPKASSPLLQEYFVEGLSGSVQASGFIDETGELFVARAARKILSRPKTLGISLCLESCALDPTLAQKIRALCKELGYFGVFHIEFLQVGGRSLLIDFNPRYYHFMALDVARGVPLPLLTMLAAQGEREQLQKALAAAQAVVDTPRTFTYSMQLSELVLAQSLSGKMSLHDSWNWWKWRQAKKQVMVDAVYDPRDRKPYLLDVTTSMVRRLRHPMAFVRKIALDS